MKKFLFYMIALCLSILLVLIGVFVMINYKWYISLPIFIICGCLYAYIPFKLNDLFEKEEQQQYDDSYKNAKSLNDAKKLYCKQFDGKICYYNDIEKAFEDGAIWQKENLLNYAIDCNVDWYDGPLLNITKEEQDELLINKLNVKFKDKLKIIILKSEEL